MALIHSSARSAVILEYSEKSAKTKDAVLTTHTILYLGASKVVLCHWWRAPEHHLQPRELRLHERQVFCSLRKQKTSCDPTGGFLAKWRLKNEHGQIPYPWRATAHIWVVLLIGRSKFPTNRSSDQIWVLASHQYGISLLVSQTSLRRETSGGEMSAVISQARQVNKWRLFCFLYQPSLFSVFFSVFCFGDSPHYLKKKITLHLRN